MSIFLNKTLKSCVPFHLIIETYSPNNNMSWGGGGLMESYVSQETTFLEKRFID
jgi:hypothetical protein